MSRPTIGGPLGELLDGAPEPPDGTRSLVHGRVLEVAVGDGAAWVLASFEPAPDAPALHRAMKERVEALLLSELSRSAKSLREEGRKRYDRIWFASFAPLPPDADRALAPFGFRPIARSAGDDGAEFRGALAALRHEGGVDEPTALFEATIAHGPTDAAHDALASALGDRVWGERPRLLFDRALAAFAITGNASAVSELELLETKVVSDATGVVRFIPPLLFQALADGAAAVVGELGREVQWAELHEEDGLAPPPLFRFRDGSSWAHVPIGHELLRWCVMPLAPGERPPRFSEWIAQTFR
jgi:hypothetical protein